MKKRLADILSITKTRVSMILLGALIASVVSMGIFCVSARSSDIETNIIEGTEYFHDEIDADVKNFLFGEWKVAKFLGFTAITKDNVEWPDGEKIIGKSVLINSGFFSSLDFGEEYSRYADELKNPVYNLKYKESGAEFSKWLDLSADKSIQSLSDKDHVLMIQASAEVNGEIESSPALYIINNNRLLISLNCDYFELECVESGKVISTEDFNPSYSCEAMVDEVIGLTDTYIYKFEDAEIQVNPDECLLMINGTFENAKAYIKDDIINIPLRVVTEALGANVYWDGNKSSVTVKSAGNEIVLKIDDSVAKFNGENIELGSRVLIINEKTYVPAYFITEFFESEVGFIPAHGEGRMGAKIGIAYNPVVWIDDIGLTKETTKNADEILAWIKPELYETLNLLKDNIDTVRGGLYANRRSDTFDEIEKKIDDMKYSGQIGRYLMYSGPYVILVDPIDRDVYFHYYVHAFGTLKHVDINNQEIFISRYFAD